MIVRYLGLLIIGLGLACSAPKKPMIIEEVSITRKTILPGPEYLSQWNLFDGNLSSLQPAQGVLPYDLNTPLFSDYADKLRFVKLPAGTKAQFRNQEVMDFPQGTILIKNFLYEKAQAGNSEKRKIIETRLLVHEATGWNALTYVWNEGQTDAKIEIAGTTVPVRFNREGAEVMSINYSVPNLVQCKSCHEKGGRMTPIGPTVRQLNKEFAYDQGQVVNQIDRWKLLGMLEGVPTGTLPKLAVWNDKHTGTLSERARAWLEINCAHCHQSDGPAKNTGLYLTSYEKDAYRLGINKPPVAAGRGSGGLHFAVVAGQPGQSFLLHRISSTDPGVMMPELGRKLIHEEGVKLIEEWIMSLN
ncbi:MAG: putative repeat protein (TIGR03806 family) [Cyclobacteriaceae bacterium]|jgi:uncharacterized repeat protein (TIGR03806 family)